MRDTSVTGDTCEAAIVCDTSVTARGPREIRRPVVRGLSSLFRRESDTRRLVARGLPAPLLAHRLPPGRGRTRMAPCPALIPPR